MITKLPKWILWGGAVLAFSAGCVNTAALMGFANLSVSHVTGNVSLFASAIAYLDVHSILYIGALLLSFLAGAVLSGFVIGQAPLKLGKRYGRALYLEASLLLISYWLYQQHDYLGQLAAAMACGLQNAMVATYSGAVIRTTHLTGLTSDMGAAIGNWLAGRSISKPTLGFQAIIWYCFCGGSVVGAFLYAKVGYGALLVPITIVLTAAFIYNYASDHLPEKRLPRSEKRSSS
ncbi:DUF1275 domain-containing protein [Psychrobacter sp. SCQQ22]|uniref:YoaK family protein n=1 Tax=unclassified Psychrobacter TaxID=196806 RepID=UPI0018CF2C2B|nr:YoaK family protein [Psychrobacter sp. SCQQ22]MBH0086156.1 DUF1275 domain-containing protein [Psychrobacter sp. SCQQ22]